MKISKDLLKYFILENNDQDQSDNEEFVELPTLYDVKLFLKQLLPPQNTIFVPSLFELPLYLVHTLAEVAEILGILEVPDEYLNESDLSTFERTDSRCCLITFF